MNANIKLLVEEDIHLFGESQVKFDFDADFSVVAENDMNVRGAAAWRKS